jgi:aspartate kinase
VAVLSARGKTTDALIADAFEISPQPDPREMDMLLSTGERQSCALCAMAINDLGHRAISLTGSQAGIVTDASHTKARILDVRADRIRQALDEDAIVLVAGFQGVSTAKDVTTLGRGGSDTTAVALAAALGAHACEKYSDVPGVFTADPRLVPTARRLPRISFEEMLEVSATGSGVLAHRSVEYARNHGVRLHVRSSFTWEPGTWVEEEDPSMEQAIVSAVTHDVTEAKITVHGVPDRPGVAARLFRQLADRKVSVDMIVQNTSVSGATDISFTVPTADVAASLAAAEAVGDDIGAAGAEADDKIARVSVVGAGMKTNPGVAATMFETLAEAGINIEMISTSPIRISCVIRGDQVEDAVRVLHDAYGLDRLDRGDPVA